MLVVLLLLLLGRRVLDPLSWDIPCCKLWLLSIRLVLLLVIEPVWRAAPASGHPTIAGRLTRSVSIAWNGEVNGLVLRHQILRGRAARQGGVDRQRGWLAGKELRGRGRRGRRFVRVDVQQPKVTREVVISEQEPPTAKPRGLEHGTGRFLGRVAARRAEPHNISASRLDDADAVASTGGSAASTAILIAWWVHPSPELSECRSIVQKDLPYISNEGAHVGDVRRGRLPRVPVTNKGTIIRGSRVEVGGRPANCS